MSLMDLHAGTSARAAASPRLQQACRLLQMPSLEFAQALRAAMDGNPFLEHEDAEAVSIEDGETWGAEPAPRSAAPGDDMWFERVEAHPSLASHLAGQLNVLRLPERDLLLATVVAGSLDDDGYLRVPLDEVAGGFDLDPPPSAEELAIALKRVQALDPAGVGARSVAECLRLQLASIACDELRGLARETIARHLDLLAERDVRALASALGCDTARVEAVIAAVRRLDPRPGWRFSAVAAGFIVPDVIVRRVRGQWAVALNEAVVPRVRVNDGYADLWRRHKREAACDARLDDDLREARWTVRNVEQRFSTILAVAQAILKRQHRFLTLGAMAMKPLSLREIGDELGIHESTVSRVTNGKYMATPCGVFELKFFFSRGLATANGGACSPRAVRELVGQMIAGEPAADPLSDVEIARRLAAQGLQVARRTVTKYRQLLRIAPAEERRHASA